MKMPSNDTIAAAIDRQMVEMGMNPPGMCYYRSIAGQTIMQGISGKRYAIRIGEFMIENTEHGAYLTMGNAPVGQLDTDPIAALEGRNFHAWIVYANDGRLIDLSAGHFHTYDRKQTFSNMAGIPKTISGFGHQFSFGQWRITYNPKQSATQIVYEQEYKDGVSLTVADLVEGAARFLGFTLQVRRRPDPIYEEIEQAEAKGYTVKIDHTGKRRAGTTPLTGSAYRISK